MADDKNRGSDYSRNKEQPLPFLPEDDDSNLTADDGGAFGADSFRISTERGRRAAQKDEIDGDSFSGIGGDSHDREEDESLTSTLMTLSLAQLMSNAYEALDDSDRSREEAENRLNTNTAASDAYRDTTFMESYMEYSKEALALEELNKQLEEAKASGDQAKITELNEKIAQQEITKKQALDKYEIAAKPMNDAYTKRTELTTQLEELKIKQDELRKSLDGATDADKATIAKQLEELKIKQESLDIKAAELDTTLAGFQSQITQANAAMTGETSQVQEAPAPKPDNQTMEQKFTNLVSKNGGQAVSFDQVKAIADQYPNASTDKIITAFNDAGGQLDSKSIPSSLTADDRNFISQVQNHPYQDITQKYNVSLVGDPDPSKDPGNATTSPGQTLRQQAPSLAAMAAPSGPSLNGPSGPT